MRMSHIVISSEIRHLRFPRDFVFDLTREERENWRSQFVTSNFMSAYACGEFFFTQNSPPH